MDEPVLFEVPDVVEVPPPEGKLPVTKNLFWRVPPLKLSLNSFSDDIIKFQ